MASTRSARTGKVATRRKGSLRFRPAARLQYLLSEQLVSDANVAVLEFIKNAYDADATAVIVEFDLDASLGNARLLISDDGTGMDPEEFKRNWMSPGYSEKIDAAPTSKKRIPVGEKGLGRLAAGRLGAALDVYSRKSTTEPWFHIHFRWDDFDNQEKLLDEIAVPWDLESAPREDVFSSGTIIEISELSVKWNSRPPGRRPAGRAVTRIGRLRQDLEVLLLPLTASGDDFTIYLRHNSELSEDQEDLGPDGQIEVTPSPKLLGYEYRFEVKKRSKTKWQIVRTIRRSASIAAQTGQSSKTRTRVNVEDLSSLSEVNLDDTGQFEGSFYYAPDSQGDFKKLRVPTGVRIYRDGVRIDPYGDPTDDWLGASERKAVRQGYAPIAPNALYGAVQVSRKLNPRLEPLANREGFIGNVAFDTLLTICRSEFAAFGDYIQAELVDPRWERRQTEKRTERSFSSRQWSLAMTRATAHVVRQPVTSAGADLRTLERRLEKETSLSDRERESLLELAAHTRGHLKRIDSAIGKMLHFLELDPEPRETELISLVEEAISRVTPDATSGGVDLSFVPPDRDVNISVPAELVEHAIEELLHNAIQAPRPVNRVPSVKVSIGFELAGKFRVIVTDNGSGIPENIRAKLFSQTVSSTGRIGVGLMFNRQLMTIARGDIELDETNSSGSTFSLKLPS